MDASPIFSGSVRVSDVASAKAALVAGIAAALSVIKTYAKDRVTG